MSSNLPQKLEILAHVFARPSLRQHRARDKHSRFPGYDAQRDDTAAPVLAFSRHMLFSRALALLLLLPCQTVVDDATVSVGALWQVYVFEQTGQGCRLCSETY